MGLPRLRRFCELQLYTLIFALPFEYYFGDWDQSLYTSLKLQIVLLLATWLYMTLSGSRGTGWEVVEKLEAIISGRIGFAVAAFVLVQWLAASFAPEFRTNALKAAGKASLGAILSIVAADLLAGSASKAATGKRTSLRPLLVLSYSGTCMALLGLGALAGNSLFVRIVHFFQSSEYLLGSHVRFSSTMEYPNTAGSFLSVSFCACLALAVFPGTSRRSEWKWLWFAAMALQGAALTLTYSRGGLAAAVIAIAAASWALRAHISTSHRKWIFAVCVAVLSAGTMVLFVARSEAGRGGTISAKRTARYGLDAELELRILRPDQTYRQIIEVKNDGHFQWRRGEYGIAYRWHRLSDDQNSTLYPGATFQDGVAPGRNVRVPVSIKTPAREGEYLLIWFVFGGSDEMHVVKNSYSPATLCIIDSVGVGKDLSEKAQRYLRAVRQERQDLNYRLVPGRAALHAAAFRMAQQKPLLGMGPDNFRLIKWKFMDTPEGDETILANSLYLEMLSGSGTVGLVCFLWLIWEFCRLIAASVSSGWPRADGALPYFGVAYLAGLLSHGFVDYFLKFTPTFLLFWLTLGMMLADRAGTRRSRDANRV